METKMSRHLGRTRSSSTIVRYPSAQNGHTLVELLVAVTLGSVVLASLGGVLLVSEMKVSANIQGNLEAKDSANRAIDLMRREATSSRFFNINYYARSSSGSITDCRDSTPIKYFYSSGTEICYKTVPSERLLSSYPADLKGPCVLVRVGPAYKPDGNIIPAYNPDGTPNQKIQVLLDGLKKTPSQTCSSNLNQGQGLVASFVSEGVGKLLQVEINLMTGASYKFSVQAPSNSAYDGNDLYDANRPSGVICYQALQAKGCDSGSLEMSELAFINHRPELITGNASTESSGCSSQNANDSILRICGAPSKENVFYFTKPLSKYILSGSPPGSDQVPCTYNNCYIYSKDNGRLSLNFQTGWFSNVDLLVFPDKQIRPTS